MGVVETTYVFDLLVWGAAVAGLAFFSYSAWFDYHRKGLDFKLYLSLAVFAFFVGTILHVLNAYLNDALVIWRIASVFDALTLLTWSVSVSIFMAFEKPRNFMLPGLSIVMLLAVIALSEDYAKLLGYIIALIILVSIVSIYINMARISAGAIRTKAMFYAIGFLCLLVGRLFRSSLLVGALVASPITILGGFIVLLGLGLLAHTN